MITIRPSQERGPSNLGWLDSKHSFSFAHYHDPNHMGFRALRVINEDKVAPGAGFDTHGHRNMEILSYPIEGVLAHKDNTGNKQEIRVGDVQRMSAGTGIMHSEFNGSDSDPVHFLQIWIIPEAQGLKPSYEQKHFSASDKQDQLRLVASNAGRDGSVQIHQDVDLFASVLTAGSTVGHALSRDRHAWIQVVRGAVTVNGFDLGAGDGASVSDESELKIVGGDAGGGSEFLLFDLA